MTSLPYLEIFTSSQILWILQFQAQHSLILCRRLHVVISWRTAILNLDEDSNLMLLF